MNAEERTRLIEQRKESTPRKVRLWCKDEWRMFDIFRVPVEPLLLNVDNRRFAAERKLWEARLNNRSLDPENSPDDELSVIAILLDSNLDVDGGIVSGTPTKDTEALEDDWLRRKQESPFWIRPDGTVHNGNRRLAILKRLRRDGVEGTEWVEAIILEPAEIDERDLFEMEQREQLTEDFKIRYTDINLLLALREAAIGREIDWADPDDIQRVAGELQHVAGGDEAYAAIQLQAIRYMDEYLKDSSVPGRYERLLRQVERFRDVGKVMSWIEERYPDSAADMLGLAFAAIRAGCTHDDIRALRKMFQTDRPRFDSLLAAVEDDEKPWAEVSGPQLADPDLSPTDEGEDGEDGANEPPGPVVPNYPKDKVRTRFTNAIDGFRASSLHVASILEQTLNRLEVLTDTRQQLSKALAEDSDASVRGALTKIVEWAERARELLKAK
jgi:hypothetical protein